MVLAAAVTGQIKSAFRLQGHMWVTTQTCSLVGPSPAAFDFLGAGKHSFVRWNKHHLPVIKKHLSNIWTSFAPMASILASEMYHVVGSVATSQQCHLAQMGLYLSF